MNRFEPAAFAVMRVVVGLLFATHGSQKIVGFPSGAAHLPPMLLVAGWIELVGGILITIGLFGRWAALVTGGEMAYAYLMVHAPNGPIPLVNKGELAVLYGIVFFYLIFHGSGIWSVDSAIRKPAAATPSSGGAARP